ncbi:MAG: RHS repeat-associated core domain-containing protein [Armatimonadetes bacterium]|nr:RHS repeat-associated core domain-containing protein [Armatimonadota bacterium]MDE2206359.1 RHS repeat-associated core domain-containing protein [Armatimonadota bacterium]
MRGACSGKSFDAFGSRSISGTATDPYSGLGSQYGYYSDTETGLQLLGYRYYDPAEGRFVNRDPIGMAGGVNVYGYVANDAGNLADPDGTVAAVRHGPPIPRAGVMPVCPACWQKGVGAKRHRPEACPADGSQGGGGDETTDPDAGKQWPVRSSGGGGGDVGGDEGPDYDVYDPPPPAYSPAGNPNEFSPNWDGDNQMIDEVGRNHLPLDSESGDGEGAEGCGD